jgi:hypothetical protein
MSQSRSAWLSHWTFRILAAATIAIVVSGVWGLENAFAQKEKPSLSAEDRSRDVTNLKQAFGSSQIDLYFEMGELESQKPGLTGVKFVDVVDVTGKELLRFERSGDSWLIDPDTVFAYRLHKSK